MRMLDISLTLCEYSLRPFGGMEDTADLRSVGYGHAGSSPVAGITPVAQSDRASDYGFEG